MVVDELSGQIVSVEELVKRTKYRCSASPRSSNITSRADSEGNLSRTVPAALLDGPGLTEVGLPSNKRKAQGGEGKELLQGKKRPCV